MGFLESLNIKSEGRVAVYHTELRAIAGSVTATLLLRQMIYWYRSNGNKPFYKFIVPSPMNEKYNEGDSWEEELGFSYKEFKASFGILSLIGVASKKKNSERVTYYSVDFERIKYLNDIGFVYKDFDNFYRREKSVANKKGITLDIRNLFFEYMQQFKVVEPKVEPKVVEPKVVEPKVVEPKVVEPKVVEPFGFEMKTKSAFIDLYMEEVVHRTKELGYDGKIGERFFWWFEERAWKGVHVWTARLRTWLVNEERVIAEDVTKHEDRVGIPKSVKEVRLWLKQNWEKSKLIRIKSSNSYIVVNQSGVLCTEFDMIALDQESMDKYYRFIYNTLGGRLWG